MSIGLACNIFEEKNAVHGLLESASQFFDELFFFHCGPGGKYSEDGTIEILEKWGVRIEFGDIHDGFGRVRTQLVQMSNCDWVMIMDADERFYPNTPLFAVEGEEKYPDVESPNLKVTQTGWSNQGNYLRDLIKRDDIDVIRTCRRHWFDHTWKRPCQNWHHVADWQARILRTNGNVGFDPNVAMHEKLISKVGGAPRIWEEPSQGTGPYHDHFHCWYKPMEPEQRAADIEVYNRIHEGSVPQGDCNQT